MQFPASLRALPHDRAAATELRRSIDEARDALLRTLGTRQGTVDELRETWSGPHRDVFEVAEDDVQDARRLVLRLLDDVRVQLDAQEAALEEENAHRAEGRRLWLRAQAEREARAAGQTGPAGGGWW